MADSGGFEPPTARFVAEYSIQLSYESVTDHSKATALGYASLKPNSECSFRKLNCASSFAFASPTLRSLRFRAIFGAFRPDHRWLKQNGLQRCKPFNMADSGGFEPPTARFVAEYSIQLSYESGRCFYTRSPLVDSPARLSPNSLNNGGEGGIRTPDTLLRCTPLAGERLRPLGHLSATRGA
jgi:hypothetical protein